MSNTDVKNDPEGLKELGNKAFAQKDYLTAIEYYTKAIQIDKSNHVFFSNRSASYAGILQWSEAAKDAKECLRLDPSFVKGYYRLATALTEMGDFTAALATVRQGLQVENSSGNTNSNSNSNTNNSISPLAKQLRILQQLQKRQVAAKQQQQQDATSSSMPSNASYLSNLDAATNRELQELQQQYAQTRREIAVLQNNVQICQRDAKVAELTREELQESDNNDNTAATAKCYQSVGKMFWLSTQQEMLDYMEKQIDDNNKSDQEMSQKLQYLEKRLESQTQNIQELTKSAA